MPTVSIPGAVEVAFGLEEVAVPDAEVAARVVPGAGDDEEHAARPSASAPRQAVCHDGRRRVPAVRSGRAGALAGLVIMLSPDDCSATNSDRVRT